MQKREYMCDQKVIKEMINIPGLQNERRKRENMLPQARDAYI